MHELSLAAALLEQVRRHTPAGATVHRVVIRVGNVRAIDPDAMAFAWRAATDGTALDGAAIEIRTVEAGDELTLLSLEVEENAPCK